MKRRKFLKSLGATALLPSIPMQPLALAQASSAVSTSVFSAHTYQWAEMIVRAHNRCNLGLLQRSLHIDAPVAEALKSALIRNGIVHAQANSYGIHGVTSPLYEGAFMNVSETVEKTANSVIDALKTNADDAEPADSPTSESYLDFNELEAEPESVDEEANETALTTDNPDQFHEIET